jgi:predicted nuclease of restriction endonuclease-like (RecB) superfamily
MNASIELPPSYAALLEDLKGRIRTAQVRAAFAVNQELLLLYWSIGGEISARFQTEKWGGKIVDRLAHDLQAEFPGVEGFSPRNLRYMRSFAEAWPDSQILQQVAAKLPWGHHMVLLDKVKGSGQRSWYLRAALEYGWSRAILVHQIDGRLHERQGKALTNFSRTLPPGDSDLAEQILKDPYNFDFLSLGPTAREPGTRTRAADPSARSAAGTGPGIRVCGQPGSAHRGGGYVLRGPALLPRPAALLLRYRIEAGAVQAGVRGQTELLSVRCRWHSTHGAGRSHDWPSALREPERAGRGVCLQGHPKADRRFDVSRDPRASRRPAIRSAVHRRPGERGRKAAFGDAGSARGTGRERRGRVSVRRWRMVAPVARPFAGQVYRGSAVRDPRGASVHDRRVGKPGLARLRASTNRMGRRAQKDGSDVIHSRHRLLLYLFVFVLVFVVMQQDGDSAPIRKVKR